MPDRYTRTATSMANPNIAFTKLSEGKLHRTDSASSFGVGISLANVLLNGKIKTKQIA